MSTVIIMHIIKNHSIIPLHILLIFNYCKYKKKKTVIFVRM